MNVTVGDLRTKPLPTSSNATHTTASVLYACESGLDLFGKDITVEKCRLCRLPLLGKQIWFHASDCRSEWHRLWDNAHTEKRQLNRASRRESNALQFIIQHPELIVYMVDGIRADIKNKVQIKPRSWWERGKAEFNLHCTDWHEPFVKRHIRTFYPDLVLHLQPKRTRAE